MGRARTPDANWALTMLAKRPGAGVVNALGTVLAHAKKLGAPGETVGLLAREAGLVPLYRRHGFTAVAEGSWQMRAMIGKLR